uniref:Fatty acid hydroxylase n=1 Tax=Solibacter usitatus (strain Ellin6076) TaxID=234267 RepID=Q01VA7_SOLUE
MRVTSAKPLMMSAGWAVGAYVAAVGVQVGAGGPVRISLRALMVLLAGGIYANLFEHLWHRYGMHVRRDPRHARHHRIFYGDRFQANDPKALDEIVTAWYIFPVLLAVHYTPFWAIFGAGYAPAFFLGVVLHFVTYEVTHWYTHVEDNRFDRVMSRIPGLSRLRAAQIRHHRMHHAEPMINFNFNPPYAGDRLAGVLRR